MTTQSSSNLPTGASGTILQGQGVGTASAFTTATYPATTTQNRILYSSSNNVVGQITSANSAVLVTTSAGVPQMSGTMTNGQLIIGSTGATPTAAALTAGNTNMTVTNGAGSITLTPKGTLINAQYFTALGASTYTPTTGTNTAVVEVIGAGGGGGSAVANGGSGANMSGGGGGGAYAIKRITSVTTQTVTIGTGGTAGSASDGGTGGTSSFGAIISCTGGGGGKQATAATTGNQTFAGGNGGTATGGDVNVNGTAGGAGNIIGGAFNYAAGRGAGTQYSSFTSFSADAVGETASGYGGGGGATGNSSNVAHNGGAGGNGLVIVWEYT